MTGLLEIVVGVLGWIVSVNLLRVAKAWIRFGAGKIMPKTEQPKTDIPEENR